MKIEPKVRAHKAPKPSTTPLALAAGRKLHHFQTGNVVVHNERDAGPKSVGVVITVQSESLIVVDGDGVEREWNTSDVLPTHPSMLLAATLKSTLSPPPAPNEPAVADDWVDGDDDDAAEVRVGMPCMNDEDCIAAVVVEVYRQTATFVDCNGDTSTECIKRLRVPRRGSVADRLTPVAKPDREVDPYYFCVVDLDKWLSEFMAAHGSWENAQLDSEMRSYHIAVESLVISIEDFLRSLSLSYIYSRNEGKDPHAAPPVQTPTEKIAAKIEGLARVAAAFPHLEHADAIQQKLNRIADDISTGRIGQEAGKP